MTEKPDREALAVGRGLVKYEGIQSTFNRRRAAEQAYYIFHHQRGARLRAKYRLPV